jgi:hypothetical protein
MFDSLDERMKADERAETSTAERLIKWGLVAIGSVLLFGGLYYGVRFVE